MRELQYRPSHVANFFLRKAAEEDRPLTQMKLLKLVYIAYGWVYAVLDRPLFEEDIEAWLHGPVIPALYDEFKRFGSNPIDRRANEFDLETLELTQPEINPKDTDLLIILDVVWDSFKRFSAWDLRNKTHERGTPWTETWDGGRGRFARIKPALIQAHFKDRIHKYLEPRGQQQPVTTG